MASWLMCALLQEGHKLGELLDVAHLLGRSSSSLATLASGVISAPFGFKEQYKSH